MRRLLVLGVLVVLCLPAAAASGSSGPLARVGAIYFDGWACPLSNFHFNGLLDTPFSGRRPLSGWRDNAVESMRTQLTWAHQDGIGFFLFDWYRENVDPCLDVALQNYKSLPDHQGVGFALLLVHNDVFAISPNEWPALAERWVTEDFLNPDYERVEGKPLFVILDTTLFREEMGGTSGVNAALATLRATAERHGLPGVFVVGGRYTAYGNIDCFPDCDATDGGPSGLRLEHYDALSEYNSAGTPVPRSGARPYSELSTAVNDEWQRFADTSPIPWIPSVTDGWDPRPWDERPFGYLFWFVRTPQAVASFLGDAVNWVAAHPAMRVEPSGTPPLVLLEAWNELGEGSHVLPTVEDGYRYGEALAGALGVGWSTTHARRFMLERPQRGLIRGTLSVLDGWTPCDVAQLRLERRTASGWRRVVTLRSRPGGSFSARLHRHRATYRITAPAAERYAQSCGAARSSPFHR